MSDTESKEAAGTFVLIAGAWHGAWCWERVAPLLAAAGHRVLAPDLPGMGRDPTPLAGVTLASWADQIAGVIGQEADPVVLVGHSRGGLVTSEVAERIPDRIATLVHVSGSLVPAGESILTILKPEPGATDLLQMREDGSAMLPGDIAAAMLYDATAAGRVRAALPKPSPEPPWIHATPSAVTAERFGRVKRACIETLSDRALPLDRRRSMQAALPCAPVLTLDSDHSPFLSRPDELAKCPLSVVAQLGRRWCPRHPPPRASRCRSAPDTDGQNGQPRGHRASCVRIRGRLPPQSSLEATGQSPGLP